MHQEHHIIPRHVYYKIYGTTEGLDDPSNLVKLTVDEHAAWHYELWCYYGFTEDWIAWKGLSGLAKDYEVKKEIMMLGSIKGGEINKISGHMSRVGKILSTDERKVIGKLGVDVCRKKEVNAFLILI